MLLNVVDVEATCWDGAPPEGQVSEIIEIGLTVVDLAAGERVAKHKILVRPERSAVSAFCTQLTGLTQAAADSGLSFADACRVLVSEHHSPERPWASWGEYDRKQFRAQCAATGAGYPFGGTHVNAKAMFGAALNRGRRTGMAAALQKAGLPLEGRHHDGADDAWNIAALILHLHANGHWPLPFGSGVAPEGTEGGAIARPKVPSGARTRASKRPIGRAGRVECQTAVPHLQRDQ